MASRSVTPAELDLAFTVPAPPPAAPPSPSPGLGVAAAAPATTTAAESSGGASMICVPASSRLLCLRSPSFAAWFSVRAASSPTPLSATAPLVLPAPPGVSPASLRSFVDYVHSGVYIPPHSEDASSSAMANAMLPSPTSPNFPASRAATPPPTAPTILGNTRPIHNVSQPAVRRAAAPADLVALYRLAADHGVAELGRLVAEDLVRALVDVDVCNQIRHAADVCDVPDVRYMADAWRKRMVSAGGTGGQPVCERKFATPGRLQRPRKLVRVDHNE
ncbi:hypothetical protein HK405_005433 [Cladochytrium tenue]|nr:hypothetical protein HK405_005433 [Cladochytrium tenue]